MARAVITVIPNTPAALLQLIDRRHELGQLEDTLLDAGWPWCWRRSAWVDVLVLEIENRRR